MLHLRRIRVYLYSSENEVSNNNDDKTEEDLHSKLELVVLEDTALQVKRQITGLAQCTKYYIQVRGHYDIDEERTVGAPLTTKCTKKKGKNIFLLHVSVDDLFVVCIGCLLLIASVSFFVCFDVRRRRRRNAAMHRVYSEEIVDPRDFGL